MEDADLTVSVRRAGLWPATGKGLVVCDRSGAQVPADHIVDDVRGGRVRREDADFTPGFGTHHPQDLVDLPVMDDPRPIEHARPLSATTSLWEQGYTDAQIRAAVRAGVPLGEV